MYTITITVINLALSPLYLYSNPNPIIIIILRFILSVCLSVCNGSSPEVAWPRAKSCSQLGTHTIGGHGEDAVVHACQGTNDGQGHELIQRAGQERDTSGHLLIKESRWRGSLIHGERLAWVTAQGPRTAVSSAVITIVFQTNYKRGNEFLHRLIKFAMCTDRKKRLRHCNLCTRQ